MQIERFFSYVRTQNKFRFFLFIKKHDIIIYTFISRWVRPGEQGNINLTSKSLLPVQYLVIFYIRSIKKTPAGLTENACLYCLLRVPLKLLVLEIQVVCQMWNYALPFGRTNDVIFDYT